MLQIYIKLSPIPALPRLYTAVLEIFASIKFCVSIHLNDIHKIDM